MVDGELQQLPEVTQVQVAERGLVYKAAGLQSPKAASQARPGTVSEKALVNGPNISFIGSVYLLHRLLGALATWFKTLKLFVGRRCEGRSSMCTTCNGQNLS